MWETLDFGMPSMIPSLRARSRRCRNMLGTKTPLTSSSGLRLWNTNSAKTERQSLISTPSTDDQRLIIDYPIISTSNGPKLSLILIAALPSLAPSASYQPSIEWGKSSMEITIFRWRISSVLSSFSIASFFNLLRQQSRILLLFQLLWLCLLNFINSLDCSRLHRLLNPFSRQTFVK